MKRFLFLPLIALFAALTGNFAYGFVRDRKTLADEPPLPFVNGIGMKFVWIPPGNFLMGSPAQEPKRNPGEIQHRVILKKGFYMSAHLVTREQWRQVMSNDPSHFNHEPNLPVESVSWEDSQAFIQKLRKKDGKAYRLPTEAEWEYACRAGTTTPFHFGASLSSHQANFMGLQTNGKGEAGEYRAKTTPVGSFDANAWGLHDMHGNVWQWCEDRFAPYPKEGAREAQEPVPGNFRIMRGGAWSNVAEHCRSAFRTRAESNFRNYNVGFRLCFFPD